MTSAAMPPQAIRDSEWSILGFCITSPLDCRWKSQFTLYKTSIFCGSSTEACASYLRARLALRKPGRAVRVLTPHGLPLEQYLGGPHASQSRDTSFNDHSDGGAGRNRRRARNGQYGRRRLRFHGFRRLSAVHAGGPG